MANSATKFEATTTFTIKRMKIARTIFAAIILSSFAFSQTSKPVTVPITLDHNRVVIDVYLTLPDGTSKRVRALVNTGSSDLMMSQRVAALFGPVHCDGKSCTATPPGKCSSAA